MSQPSGPDAVSRASVVAARRCSPLAAVLVALTFGVTTASVESSLGPHEARYDVTTDDTVTIDLGPLGTLQIDSPLPADPRGTRHRAGDPGVRHRAGPGAHAGRR